MATLQEFKEDLPLLVESGLIAIKQGDEDSARKLFNAVGIIDPQNMSKKMGFGLIALHKMELGSAKNYFEDVLEVEQANWRAQAFLAFTYILSVLQEGEHKEKHAALKKGAELAKEVIEKSDAPATRQLAQSLLDWEQELQDTVEGDKGPMG
ncbi:MAG: hypothetical protein K940chlam9_00093 [Chlamydiae bacterium]|nr:hypothetical protein [Chlamydiota bacterium]